MFVPNNPKSTLSGKDAMNSVKKLAIACSGTFLLAGCTSAFLNEGSIQARLSPANNQIASSFKQIYFKPSETLNKIEHDDHFSISLLSSHLCGFRETRTPWELFTPDKSNPSRVIKGTDSSVCTYDKLISSKASHRTTRGEIAIIANVGEMSTTQTQVINPADKGEKGRVIYYNDDIRESGQLINAINIPIYGPRKYTGKNVFLDLWMLELDNNENKKTTALLGSLAEMGAKSYPPASPILGVLNTLGAAFLSGNKDDIEAHFQMRFDVPGPNSGSFIARLPLAEGYYALIREENRNIDTDWNTIGVNESLGVLCNATNGTCINEVNNTYRDRTWFLIRIAKETKESAVDIEYGEELNNFSKRLDLYRTSDFDSSKASIDSLTASLKKLICNKATKEEQENLKLKCD